MLSYMNMDMLLKVSTTALYLNCIKFSTTFQKIQ
jgi:hypothetical protein